MIREASVYALKKIPPAELSAYGMRVLTMRRWPRGVARRDIDIWVPDAGPSVSLLAALRTGTVDWTSFLFSIGKNKNSKRRVVLSRMNKINLSTGIILVERFILYAWHENGGPSLFCAGRISIATVLPLLSD